MLANIFRQLSDFLATTVSSPTIYRYRRIGSDTTLNKLDTALFIRIPYIYQVMRETPAIQAGTSIA